MQDCFRKYPEIYGAEIADEDDDETSAVTPEAALAKETAESPVPTQSVTAQHDATSANKSAEVKSPAKDTGSVQDEPAQKKEGKETKVDAGPGLPKEAHDATKANKGKA